MSGGRIGGSVFEYYTRLGKMRAHVLKRIHSPPTLEAAADIAGMSASAFWRHFKSKVGITYSSWVEHEQVRAAMALLRHNNDGITYVANEFHLDLRTLERKFDRVLGMTPSDYKRSVAPTPPAMNEQRTATIGKVCDRNIAFAASTCVCSTHAA